MSNDTKEYKCDICEKEGKVSVFSRGIALAGHKRSHKSPAELPAVETITWEKPDGFRLENEDPNKRYRFCSERTVDRRGWRNWSPVSPSDPVKTSNEGVAALPSKDAHRRVGDTILCSMPEDMARAREAYHRALNSPQQLKEGAVAKAEQRLGDKVTGIETDLQTRTYVSGTK